MSSQDNGQQNASAGPSSPSKASQQQPALSSTQTLVNGIGADTSNAADGAGVQQQTEQDLNQLFAARREEELARRDRSLAEFMVMLDGYKPLVRRARPGHQSSQAESLPSDT
jgi:hypothetical protein